MKLITIVLVLFVTMSLHAQKKIYIGANYQVMKDAANALYYYTIEKKEDTVIHKTYFLNDTLHIIRYYEKDKPVNRIGEERWYYPSGRLRYLMHFENNKLNGEVKVLYETGGLKRLEHYLNDSLLDGKCFGHAGNDTTCTVFLKSARYPGGSFDDLNRFVMGNVKYPILAVENGVSGRVVVGFIINSRGEVVNVRALQSPDEMLSRAAMDAVKKSERWEPAEIEGEKYAQEFALPVIFSLGSNKR